MSQIVLPGLDGSTLRGYVAAIGLLEVLSSTSQPGLTQPRLAWRQSGTWQAIIVGVPSIAELASRVLQDSKSSQVESVLAFRYGKVEKNGMKLVRSLVPPVAVLRAALAKHVSGGQPGAAEMLAALMCESQCEPVGKEPVPSAEELSLAGIEYEPDQPLDQLVAQTPFDFTSRNTQFLDQIRIIRDVLTTEVVADDLVHGLGANSERIMRWDPLVDLPSALFRGISLVRRPASEWLMFRGIKLFNLVARSGGIRMAGFKGRRKEGEFCWVLWDGPLGRDVVRTTLGLPWQSMRRSERAARGATAGFAVSLRKDATGYDGAVSPSRPLD